MLCHELNPLGKWELEDGKWYLLIKLSGCHIRTYISFWNANGYFNGIEGDPNNFIIYKIPEEMTDV
jgi:hypothetical protein